MCWRSPESSSEISASRSGRSRIPTRRFLTSSFQSRIFHSCHPVHCSYKFLPFLALLGECELPGGREPIVAAASLIRPLHPASLDPATSVEAGQKGIKRGDMEVQGSARAGVDELADVVSVPRLGFQQRQNQEF